MAFATCNLTNPAIPLTAADICAGFIKCAGPGVPGVKMNSGGFNSFGAYIEGLASGADKFITAIAYTPGSGVITLTRSDLVTLTTAIPVTAKTVVGLVNLLDLQQMGDGRKVFDVNVQVGNTSNHDVSSVGVGANAGQGNTGINVTAFGSFSLYNNLGNDSVGIGVNAGYGNQTNGLTAIGRNAGQENIGTNLTAGGYQAGYQNSGSDSAFYGFQAGYLNTGQTITASGWRAAFQNSGNNVTASGFQSAYFNSGSNVAVSGINAGFQNTGDLLAAMGYQAGFANTGVSVSGFGFQSAYQNSGTNVSAVGVNSAYQNTGDNASAIGLNAAQQNTGTNVSALGVQAAYLNTFSNVSAIGANATPTAPNQVILGNTATAEVRTTGAYFGAAFNVVSDSRNKTDVKAIDPKKAIQFASSLNWVEYTLLSDFYAVEFANKLYMDKFDSMTVELTALAKSKSKEGKDEAKERLAELQKPEKFERRELGRDYGLVAQDVQKLTESLGAFGEVVVTGPGGSLSLNYRAIDAIVSCAIQAKVFAK
jgi:Chaperone of endosialidase